MDNNVKNRVISLQRKLGLVADNKDPFGFTEGDGEAGFMYEDPLTGENVTFSAYTANERGEPVPQTEAAVWAVNSPWESEEVETTEEAIEVMKDMVTLAMQVDVEEATEQYNEVMWKTVNEFVDSDEFAPAVWSSTVAGFGGGGYSVEIFPDGHWKVLWNNQIGNQYNSPGIIAAVPKLSDSQVEEIRELEEEYGSEEEAVADIIDFYEKELIDQFHYNVERSIWSERR